MALHSSLMRRHEKEIQTNMQQAETITSLTVSRTKKQNTETESGDARLLIFSIVWFSMTMIMTIRQRTAVIRIVCV